MPSCITPTKRKSWEAKSPRDPMSHDRLQEKQKPDTSQQQI